jgi:phosphatidylinositol alpha 1,6-mannosyltransferase
LKDIPRIAYFTDVFYEANGVGTFSREFERFANRRRLPFFVVHAGSETRLRKDLVVTALELRRSPLSFPLDRELTCDPLLTRHKKLVMKHLSSFRPDLVHITGPGDVGILGAWVANSLKLPLIASWHTNLQEYAEKRLHQFLAFVPNRVRRKIASAAERRSMDALIRFYRMARLVMTPNPDMLDLLSRRTGKPAVLMHHGVDTALFNPERRNRPNGPFTLGYVGRLTPEKNVRALVGIEQALLDGGLEDFRMVLVGDGSEQRWLKTHLRRAEFPGILRGPELARTFADLDVFLFPSGTDTFGLVVLEAMASGVPAIVPLGSGPAHQVRSGQTGFLAATSSDFAQFILTLKNDPVLHLRMRKAAREHALSASWDAVFTGIYNSYESVLPPECQAAGTEQ